MNQHNNNNNTIKLKDYFEIITGYTFREATPKDSDGNLFLLQANNLSDNFFITDKILFRISFKISRTNALLNFNDVVVSSRGNIQASVIKSKKENIIASSSVYILRPQNSKILSEYLAIYLNSSRGQRDIARYLSGGSIKSILKSPLENIEIPLLPMEEQENISKLFENMEMQKELLSRKAEVNSNIVNGIINKF